MILFYEDWKKYPNAIVHLETRNESFLRLARLLKYMGIKNHAFMLALHNPLLRNVDPHDPNLDLETKQMIAEECKINFWYYIREVARVPAVAGNDHVPFRANRANIAVFWLFFNHITTYLIQPRQTGKSLSIGELLAWALDLGTQNTSLSVLTKDDKLRAKTSLTIREIINVLPEYVRFMTKKDIKNSERITVKLFNNILDLYVGRNDPKAADNVGRGMTTPIVQIDEFAYIPNIEITLPVLLAATTAAREAAERAGAPYGTIFTTTAGKLNTKEGKFAYEVYKAAMRWTEELYDLKDQKELKEVVNKNCRGPQKLILLEFNHRQLGFTDEWLKERMAAALADGEDAECDYLNKWIAGNTQHPLDKELLEIIKNSEIKNPRIEITEYGYIIRWYVTEQRLGEILHSDSLILSLDTSDAVGNDDIALVIRLASTGEVVAAGTYNETNLITFSDFIVSLLEKYDNMVFIPERRSSAIAMLDYILRIMHSKNINPFRKIFNWVYDDINKYKDKYKDLLSKRSPSMETIAELKKYFGFATSGAGKTSRSLLYGNIFKSSAKYTGDKVRDSILIEQILSLTVRNGRIDHTKSGKDDMVMSWLLGYWFLTNANNKHLYGIDVDRVLRNVADVELINKTGLTKEYIRKQELLKRKITALFDLLKKENNELVALRIINKIKLLEKDIDTRIVKNFNLDSMLKDLKIMKRLEKYTRAA